MMTTKKFYSIIVLIFFPAVFLCAQTTMDFVCRVVPSKNDEVYKTLQNAQERFNEFNYEDEASEIKNFLNRNGCMGFVIRDEAGKNMSSHPAAISFQPTQPLTSLLPLNLIPYCMT